jgi:hypothetical protein
MQYFSAVADDVQAVQPPMDVDLDGNSRDSSSISIRTHMWPFFNPPSNPLAPQPSLPAPAVEALLAATAAAAIQRNDPLLDPSAIPEATSEKTLIFTDAFGDSILVARTDTASIAEAPRIVVPEAEAAVPPADASPSSAVNANAPQSDPFVRGAEDALPEGSFYRAWMVPLCRLRFYQDFICGTFTNGRSLGTTVEELKTGAVTPETLPPIEALFHRGVWYGMGNRRLACFNIVYGKSDPFRLIPVLASHIPAGEELLHQGSGTRVRVGNGFVQDGLIKLDLVQDSAAFDYCSFK